MNTEAIPRFLDKWITPTTLLAILGGIVWGVQLNAAVLSLTDAVGRYSNELDRAQEINATQTVALARTAEILAQVQKRLDKAETHVIEHEKDAEIWKRKIMSNEAALDRLHR